MRETTSGVVQRLSRAQFSVVAALSADGLDYKGAAAKLGLTVRTVKAHVAHIARDIPGNLPPAWKVLRHAKRLLAAGFDETAKARRLTAPDDPRLISPRTRTRVMQRDGFRCRRCGCGPDDQRLEVDHIVSVSKGGTADESNLQTLCWLCNAGKTDGNPHPHDLRPFSRRPSVIFTGRFM